MNNYDFNQHKRGFTLIELLIVIAIIAILSTFVLASISGSTLAKARDTTRVQNIRELQKALELYRIDHNAYPKTFEPNQAIQRRSECAGNPNDYIPGIVSDYVAQLPSDPALNCAGVTHSWFYASDGIDYKLITHGEGTIFSPELLDPAWDGGPNDCIVDGLTSVHYGVWTGGAACWRI